MRPTRIQTFMEIAHVWAKRSTCMRRSVGAVIVADRRIISHGYNGVPAGDPHCSGNSCPGKRLCTLATHAERNAIEHMEHADLSSDMYTTDSPCHQCAVLIAEAGIKRVFFEIPYRLTQGLEFLRDHKVEVYQTMPAGYVLNYWTRDLVEPVT